MVDDTEVVRRKLVTINVDETVDWIEQHFLYHSPWLGFIKN